MQQIPTTDVTVSKLRKAAKLKVRDESIKLAAALDQVAKAAGYDHWKHVLTYAKVIEQTTGAFLAKTGIDLYYPTRKNTPSIHCVSGSPGSGKSIYLTDQILNALRQSQNVIVLECGSEQFAKAFGNANTSLSILTVDQFSQNKEMQQDEIFNLLAKTTKNTVVVVDDIALFTNRFGDDFLQKVIDALQSGASLYFSFMTSTYFLDGTNFDESPFSNLLATHQLKRVHLF